MEFLNYILNYILEIGIFAIFIIVIIAVYEKIRNRLNKK